MPFVTALAVIGFGGGSCGTEYGFSPACNNEDDVFTYMCVFVCERERECVCLSVRESVCMCV